MSDFNRRKVNRYARKLYYAIDYHPGQDPWSRVGSAVRTRYRNTVKLMMSSAFCISDLDAVAARYYGQGRRRRS